MLWNSQSLVCAQGTVDGQRCVARCHGYALLIVVANRRFRGSSFLIYNHKKVTGFSCAAVQLPSAQPCRQVSSIASSILSQQSSSLSAPFFGHCRLSMWTWSKPHTYIFGDNSRHFINSLGAAVHNGEVLCSCFLYPGEGAVWLSDRRVSNADAE